MKKIILLSSFVISSSLFAVEIKFIGPCEKDFIMKTTMPDEFATVGDVTIAALEKFNIPHTGSREGLASAFMTPVGDEAVEVISNEEMRAYGWCFAVDGVSPDVYPHEADLSGAQEITWTFGFAHYLRGQWVTQCTPAWKVKPEFLCGDLSPEQ